MKLLLGLAALWATASLWISGTGNEEMFWAASLPAGFILGIIWLMS